MATSRFVTYLGNPHRPELRKPYDIPGLPSLPIGTPVEITEDYIRRELARGEPIGDFVDMLFSYPHGIHQANKPLMFAIHGTEKEALAFLHPVEAEAETIATDVKDEAKKLKPAGGKPKA